jgi:hypothetical protein
MKPNCAGLLLAMLAAGPALAQDAAGDCERLARSAEPVELDAARVACEAAVVQSPGSPELLHLYAQTLARLGQDEAARQLFAWAASDGHEPSIRILDQVAAGMPMDQAATTGPGEDRAAADPVAALAATLGPDPQAALGWVAENVAPDVYAGAMRGARGTLAARAGSAADEALLLRAIIEAGEPGARTRLAACTLPDQEVERLWQAVLAREPVWPTPLIAAAGDVAPDIQDSETRGIIEGLAKTWDEATDAVLRNGGLIADRLAERGVAAGPAPLPETAVRAALADHLWLQVERDGRWLDLDGYAAAEGGTALCEASWTGEELPPERVHALRVEVVLEMRQDGALSEGVLLDETLRLDELPDPTLTLMMAEPVGRAEAVAPPDPPPPAGYLAYTPMLRVGDEEVLGESFALPRPATAAAGGDLGGALGGLGEALDVLGPSEEPAAPATAGTEAGASGLPEASALTLRLTMSSPGGAAETFESPIFDRIGFAARAEGRERDVALAALPEIDGEYRALATVWNLAVLTGAWPGEAAEAPDSDDPLDTLVAGLAATQGSFEILRQALVAEAAGGEAPRRARLRPGLSLLAWSPNADPAGADLMMDLLSDPSLPLLGGTETPKDGADWSAATVMAERLVVGMNRLFAGLLGFEDVPGFAPVDVLAVFDAAASEAVPVGWLEAGGIEGLRASEEAKARLARNLEEGRAVLVPARAVLVAGEERLGWWLLDPRTGLVRDEFEDGRHQGGEYAVTQQPSRQAAPTFRMRVGCTVARTFSVVSIVLGLASGNVAGAQESTRVLWQEARMAEAAEKARRAAEGARDAAGGGACGGG